MKTATNSQNPKIQEKSARKGRGHLNHKLCSENIFYDPPTVFSKPTGAIVFKIMWQGFKMNQDYEKKYTKLKIITRAWKS